MDYPGSIESRLLEALTSTVPSGRLMLKSRSLTGSLPEIEYVVYDGELYIINRDKTPSTLSVFGLDFTVARVPGEDEGYSYPGLKSGHPFLVFNGAVYSKLFVDPLIAYGTLKVVEDQGVESHGRETNISGAPVQDAPSSAVTQNVQPSYGREINVSGAPVPGAQSPAVTQNVQPSYGREAYASGAPVRGAQSPAVTQNVQPSYGRQNHSQQTLTAGVSSPASSASVRPARRNYIHVPEAPASSTQSLLPRRQVIYEKLPLGFDLSPEERRGVTFFYIPRDYPPKKTRNPWNPNHNTHLMILLEKALKYLGRPLQSGDFQAITEALKRKFQGTNQPFPERGYNAVNARVVKWRHNKYNDMVKRTLELTDEQADAVKRPAPTPYVKKT